MPTGLPVVCAARVLGGVCGMQLCAGPALWRKTELVSSSSWSTSSFCGEICVQLQLCCRSYTVKEVCPPLQNHAASPSFSVIAHSFYTTLAEEFDIQKVEL